MSTTWEDLNLVAPTRDLLAALELGDDLRDPTDCGRLPVGVEGTFRSELPAQMPTRPRESTTDGVVPEFVARCGPNSMEFVAMCFIDFSSEKFPIRAEVVLTLDRESIESFRGQIGELDPGSGAPPRLRSAAMILPDRDGDRPTAQLLDGHRVRPITWTTVVRLPRYRELDGAD